MNSYIKILRDVLDVLVDYRLVHQDAKLNNPAWIIEKR